MSRQFLFLAYFFLAVEQQVNRDTGGINNCVVQARTPINFFLPGNVTGVIISRS